MANHFQQQVSSTINEAICRICYFTIIKPFTNYENNINLLTQAADLLGHNEEKQEDNIDDSVHDGDDDGESNVHEDANVNEEKKEDDSAIDVCNDVDDDANINEEKKEDDSDIDVYNDVDDDANANQEKKYENDESDAYIDDYDGINYEEHRDDDDDESQRESNTSSAFHINHLDSIWTEDEFLEILGSQYFMVDVSTLWNMWRHSACIKCGVAGRGIVHKLIRIGMSFSCTITCPKCKYAQTFDTCPKKCHKTGYPSINTMMNWAALLSGTTYSQLSTYHAVLGTTTVPERSFYATQEKEMEKVNQVAKQVKQLTE